MTLTRITRVVGLLVVFIATAALTSCTGLDQATGGLVYFVGGTPTAVPTITLTPTPDSSVLGTPVPTPSLTPTFGPTPTFIPETTETPTPIPTKPPVAPSPTWTTVPTGTPVPSPSVTPTPEATQAPQPSPTTTSEPTATVMPTATVVPTQTVVPVPISTVAPTITSLACPAARQNPSFTPNNGTWWRPNPNREWTIVHFWTNWFLDPAVKQVWQYKEHRVLLSPNDDVEIAGGGSSWSWGATYEACARQSLNNQAAAYIQLVTLDQLPSWLVRRFGTS